MREASKAAMRRNFDRRFATTYFVGNGIDIGCGSDPVDIYREFYPLMGELKRWDQRDGDGALLEGVTDESFDFVHSSHSLEHMSDPYVAMNNWIRVLKPGGHMIIMVPDEDMFEQGVWPSQYTNGDHLSAWTIYKKNSWCPASRNIVDFFKFNDMEILKIEKLDATYLYNQHRMDQTQTQITECAIEIILRKKTEQELRDKGRLPPQQMFTITTG